MKKLLPLMGLLGVVLSTCLAGGCAGAEVKAFSDPEKAIEINAGDEFDIVIALESNPTTGYSWQASYSDTQLVLVEKRFASYQGPEELVGSGGTETFRFKTQKSGEARVTMSYQRPWEAGALIQKVFTIIVK